MSDGKKIHRPAYSISAGIVAQMIAYLKTTQADVPFMLMSAGITEDQLLSLDERIDIDAYIYLENAAASAVDDPYFGLHMGQMTEVGNWGILGYMMMNCDHVGEAFQKFARYSDIVGNLIKGEFRIDEDKENMIISLSIPKGAPIVSRHCYEGYLASLLALANTLTGKKIYPLEVGLTSQRPNARSEYEKLFGERVYFEQDHNYMILEKQITDTKIGIPNKNLLTYFEQYAADFLNEMDQTFVYQVKKILLSYMDRGDMRISKVAEEMWMSVRSFQLRLKEEGTDFSTILKETRVEISKKYLREGHTAEDITYLLGFSDVVVFRKAFKKWVGMTPKEYRCSFEHT